MVSLSQVSQKNRYIRFEGVLLLNGKTLKEMKYCLIIYNTKPYTVVNNLIKPRDQCWLEEKNIIIEC